MAAGYGLRHRIRAFSANHSRRYVDRKSALQLSRAGAGDGGGRNPLVLDDSAISTARLEAEECLVRTALSVAAAQSLSSPSMAGVERECSISFRAGQMALARNPISSLTRRVIYTAPQQAAVAPDAEALAVVRFSNCRRQPCRVDVDRNIIYKFQGGLDGFIPAGNLAIDARGNLYGVTEGDGNDSRGTWSN